jgi:hypothetical protein
MRGKRYPNEHAARAAIANAERTWTPPVLIDVGPGPHIDHALIEQRLADPTELEDGTWAVIDADHPDMRDGDEEISHEQIRKPRRPDQPPRGNPNEAPGQGPKGRDR